MIDWKFNAEEQQFDEVPVGNIRLRVKQVEEAKAQSGKDMLILTFDVSGCRATLRHYIVFLPDNPEVTNRNLTQFFDSFGINRGDFNINNWVGKVGGAFTFKNDYNDKEYVKVKYFLSKKQQESLSAWVEPTKDETNKLQMVEVNENLEMPF